MVDDDVKLEKNIDDIEIKENIDNSDKSKQ